jgi:hypothetical protein
MWTWPRRRWDAKAGEGRRGEGADRESQMSVEHMARQSAKPQLGKLDAHREVGGRGERGEREGEC